MEITSNATRIRLAAFQLEGEAQVWWKWARTSRDLEAMTWAEFLELFIGKYFPVLRGMRGSGVLRAEVGGDDCDGLCG